MRGDEVHGGGGHRGGSRDRNPVPHPGKVRHPGQGFRGEGWPPIVGLAVEILVWFGFVFFCFAVVEEVALEEGR